MENKDKIVKIQPEFFEKLKNASTKEELDKIWDEIYPHFQIETNNQISKCCQQLKSVYDYAWKISKKENWTVNYNCSECENGWIHHYKKIQK